MGLDTIDDLLSDPNPGTGAERFTLQGPDGASANIKELRAGYRQGFVFELIDLRVPEPLAVHVMVLNPTSYTLSEPHQVQLTPTEGDNVIEESQGIIVREITLQGTYGIKDKRAAGFLGSQGGGKPMSGADHFEALRNLFRRYSSLKKSALNAAHIKLIFHVLRDDDHFIVVPRSFDTPRDRTTRVHYAYNIKLAAVDEATTSLLRRPPSELEGFDFTQVLRDINEGFNDARAAFADVTSNLDAAKRKVANIQTVLGSAAQILNAVGGVITGASNLINYPLQLVATVTDQLTRAADQLIVATAEAPFGTLAETARSIRRLESAIDRIAMYDEKFADMGERLDSITELFEGERRLTNADVVQSTVGALTEAGDPATSGGATAGSRTRVVLGSDGRLAGLRIARDSDMRAVVVMATDTLESIAGRWGTTPETIIIINDLRSPYITRGGGPGILKPGDTVLVPSAGAGGRSSGRGANSYISPEDALYGVDVAFDTGTLESTGKFDIRANLNGTDWDTQRGIKNVVQGVQILIGTERGATVFLPELGIRRNIGTKGTIQHVLLASITLREAILSDSRITSIQSSRVELNGDVLTQEITPVVSGQQRSTTFVLPFGRASGGGG